MPVWVQRWWAVHNRKTDISRVTLLYEEVFKMAEKGVEDDDKILLMTALKDSINGLNNLKTTYEEDITCAASIEYIIERISPYIAEEE